MIKFIVLLFIYFLSPALAFAGTIKINFSANATISGDNLKTDINFTNLGDETAHQVKAEVLLEDNSFFLEEEIAIPPQSSYIKSFSRTVSFKKPGIYYFVIYLYYKDAAGFEFKLPFLTRLINGKENNSGLEIEGRDFTINQDQVETFKLKNNENVFKQVKLKYFPPMNVKFSSEIKEVNLYPNSSREIELSAKGKKLWPNQYMSYILAEFETDTEHFSSGLAVKLIASGKDHSEIDEIDEIINYLLVIIILGYFIYLYRTYCEQTSRLQK